MTKIPIYRILTRQKKTFMRLRNIIIITNWPNITIISELELRSTINRPIENLLIHVYFAENFVRILIFI